MAFRDPGGHLLIDHPTAPHHDEPWRVLFTRGQGCAQIAEVVSGGTATRVEDDLKTACITHRANILVTARAGSFDLVSTLVPHGVEDDHKAPAVIGAVGTGPHSPLVAAATALIAAGWGADAMLVTMSAEAEDDESARRVLETLAAQTPAAETRLVRAGHPSELLESLPPDGLVVLGAPGGSWWQRQFFGPGRKLIHAAPAGSLVVRAVPRRVFHSLVELGPIGPLMRAADAAAVTTEPVIPVVEKGRVIGRVDRRRLREAPPDTPVGELIEPAIVIPPDEPLEAVGELSDALEGAPVPVVDDENRLLGGVRP